MSEMSEFSDKYPNGFGTQMGEYGDSKYPEFFPGNQVIVSLPTYSNKIKENINIGEATIIDAPVYDGKKPYLIKLYKYGTENYKKYPSKYYGDFLENNSYLLVSRENIKIVSNCE